MLDWIFRWFSKKDSETGHVSTTETIDGTEFARLVTNGTSLLDELEGSALFHRTFGEGRLIRIQERSGYMPLITVRFHEDPEDRKFNLKAFLDGYFPRIQIGVSLLKRLRSCPPRPVVDDRPKRCEEPRYSPTTGWIPPGRSERFLPRWRQHRVTHCWHCKRGDLDSAVNRICPECGGIICPHCGACLCGWGK